MDRKTRSLSRDRHSRTGNDLRSALKKMIGSPNMSSRRWVWEQYDTLIQGNTRNPGGDAGVVRVDEGHEQGACLFLDVTPRYARPTRSRAASRRSPKSGAT
jgi:phosphoribosylformylglycinamidine (FGAM) synthase-like enzyme